MSSLWDKTTFGSTGLRVSRLGLASSYGVAGRDVERAFERGINYLYWGSARTATFGDGLREVARRNRNDAVIVIQSYTRVASMMRASVERALKRIGTDHADVVLLGWWNKMPSAAILDAVRSIRSSGLARAVMISCHNRTTFPSYIADPTFDAIMVRYNAAHPGAETEVFPHLAAREVGVVAYTATRWGAMIDARHTPAGEHTPRASDCYRFALSSAHVDVCLAGPADAAQLDEALAALDRGPMTADELAWMKRVGVAVRSAGLTRTGNRAMQIVDKLVDWVS